VRRRVRVESDGVELHFFYENGSQSVLHITSKHGTTPTQAIDAFFQASSRYDNEQDWLESVGQEHAILWNWIEESKSLCACSGRERWRGWAI